jgi:hypothetical protein
MFAPENFLNRVLFRASFPHACVDQIVDAGAGIALDALTAAPPASEEENASPAEGSEARGVTDEAVI